LDESTWRWLFPAFLLWDESYELLGYNPTSLGLPPQPRGEPEPMGVNELIDILCEDQRHAVATFTELWHWQRCKDEEFSHWDAFWKKY